MSPKITRRSAAASQTIEQVTLIVYGWHENAPGTLAWVFPSYGAAVSAVRALRNAVRWLIVAGRRTAEVRPGIGNEDRVDIDRMRKSALVLAEGFA
jgi:hypothetical protein